MQRVFVIDNNKKPLMPSHPARARELLRAGKAAVFRRFPFTIILNDDKGRVTQPVEFKVDPGSKTTGIALVAEFIRGCEVVWAGELNHRGQQIRKALEKRRAIRRSRRHRNTRYRKARFHNRKRAVGWLAPSLTSRVQNCKEWAIRLTRFVPVTCIVVESVKFDTQKMQYPEISGIEYQQGTLAGYELREYMLEKWDRKCAYCDVKEVPLEIEHIISKSQGGSDRISNLTLSCHPCNKAKGNQDIRVFVKDDNRLKRIMAHTKDPLRDIAAMNAVRYAVGNALRTIGLPLTFWSGGRTKYNRIRQQYKKLHWVDAACIGKTGEQVHIPEKTTPLVIVAMRRGSRQMCSVDKYGFPRTGPKTVKRVSGFQKGDIVELNQPSGKYAGRYIGILSSIRIRGYFDIKTAIDGVKQKISAPAKRYRLIQRFNGYDYTSGNKGTASL